MKPYAYKTRVPIDQSRIEIERTCRKYGATEFGAGWKEDAASVSFVAAGHLVRFLLPLPKKSSESEIRRRWRALLLAIKSKFEVVHSGIETFEESFLAHIVDKKTNQTIYEAITAPSSPWKLLGPTEKGTRS